MGTCPPMKTLLVAFLCCTGLTALHTQTIAVTSPDSCLTFIFSVDSTSDEHGSLFYSLSYKNKTVVRKSRLGIVTVDLPSWINGLLWQGKHGSQPMRPGNRSMANEAP
jgi:hypothetical protein